jgi:hypothetical protein
LPQPQQVRLAARFEREQDALVAVTRVATHQRGLLVAEFIQQSLERCLGLPTAVLLARSQLHVQHPGSDPARRACLAHCRCGTQAGNLTPSARTRRWRPGTRQRPPTGHAAWPSHPRLSARACARPACPPPVRANLRQHHPIAPTAPCVLLRPSGECAKTT